VQSEKEGVTPLVTLAIKDGKTVIVGLPIDKGAAVNAADGDGKSPLMVTCEKECPATVKVLLAKGAAIDPVDNGGETALTIAIHEGHDEIALLLQARGGQSVTMT
jgi:ankyrin repeat protein